MDFRVGENSTAGLAAHQRPAPVNPEKHEMQVTIDASKMILRSELPYRF